MDLKTPSFWYDTKRLGSRLKMLALTPSSWLYGMGYNIHQNMGKPYQSKSNVLCVGNLVAGGSGKTPVSLALMKLIQEHRLAEKPIFLSRGYGGSLKGPVLVSEKQHRASDVGDEPIILSETAPVIVSQNRKSGAIQAEKNGNDFIVMDDGLQNRHLKKDLSFVIIDGHYGFGNAHMLPAGPLRQPLATGMAMADAFILIGRDDKDIKAQLPKNIPLFQAHIRVPDSWICDRDMPYVAFAGMGQPQKFHSTLFSKGLNIVGWHPFADHHPYSSQELKKLADEALRKGARLITTQKDAVRLPADFKTKVALDILPVQLEWEDHEPLLAFLKEHIKKAE